MGKTVETQTVVNALKSLIEQYAAGEAEVVTTYFARPRTRDMDIAWLKKQAGRELGEAVKVAGYLTRGAPLIDKGVDRHEFESTARKCMEETRHYRMLADILESLTPGEPVDPDEIMLYAPLRPHPELPNKNSWLEIDSELKASKEPAVQHALSLTEGLGSGIYIGGSQITGSELEERMREAFHVIAEDELRHGPKDIVEVAGKIETEEDLEKAVAALREYAKRHLRMRNETFGHPLSERRLEEIDRGNVTPLRVDYTNISPISPYSM